MCDANRRSRERVLVTLNLVERSGGFDREQSSILVFSDCETMSRNDEVHGLSYETFR